MKHAYEQLESGDYVRDPLDGELRQVSYITGQTVHLKDGGVMALNECGDFYLPGDIEWDGQECDGYSHACGYID